MNDFIQQACIKLNKSYSNSQLETVFLKCNNILNNCKYYSFVINDKQLL